MNLIYKQFLLTYIRYTTMFPFTKDLIAVFGEEVVKKISDDFRDEVHMGLMNIENYRNIGPNLTPKCNF